MTPGDRGRGPWPRALRRLGVLAAILGVLAVAAWLWLLPAVVGWRVRGALEAMGARGVRLEVASLAFDRAELRDVSLGEAGALRAGRVVASFSPASLRAGRVDSLRIEDVVYQRGLPWPLPGRGGEGAGVPSPSPLPALPFDHLAIDGARIVPAAGALPDLAWTATLWAEVDRWRVAASGEAFGREIAAGFDLRVAGGTAAGPASLRVASRGLPALGLQGGARVAGAADGRLLTLELASDGAAFGFAAGGLEVTGNGTLSLRAELPLARVGEGTAALALAGVDAGAAETWRVEGASGSIRLGRLAPLQSEGLAEFAWSALSAGDFRTLTGRARFGVEAGPVLVVEEIRCALDAEGSLTIGAFRIAPDSDAIATTVTIERAPLDEWLRLVSQGRVAGTGRLDGELQVRIGLRGGLDLDVPRGELRAPGGVLRVLEDPQAEVLIREHARAVAKAAGEQVQGAVEDRIVGALREFAFDELRFELVPGNEGASGPESGGTTLRVHASGRGLRVPQELKLDVNFTGFDRALDLVLATRLGLARARERARGRPDSTQPPRQDHE